MFLLLSLAGLLSAVYIMFRYISREVIQTSALRVDSHEWHGVWEKMSQLLKDYCASVV